MLSKVRTQSRFSFRVRMKRSAQPLPSGARTKAGELSMPRKASSFWKASDMSAAEAAPHALPDRLERLEAGGPARGMDAHALSRVMIDSDEYRDLALAGVGRGQIGAPHRVHRVGDDGAVVVARASGRADPRGRKQVARAHEPQDATLGRANASHAQPGPDLPVPLAVKRAGGQNRADRLDQRGIRHRPNRARTPRRFWPGGGEMPIHAGPRRAPDPAHAGQAIGLAA